TPSVCATRLRYVPMFNTEFTLGFPLQQSQDLAQFVPHAQQHTVALRSLRCLCASQILASAGYREASLIEKALNLKDHFDVAFAVDAMSGFAFLRSEVRKLRFPEAKDVRLESGEFTHFADLEEELVRNLRLS